MLRVMKYIVKNILKLFFSLKNKVKITNGSIISYKVIQSTSRSSFLNGVICYGNVTVGRFTSISGPSTKIVAQLNNIKIGSFCSIASGVVIQEYYHKYNRVSTFYMNHYFFDSSFKNDIFSKGDIIIEDDVWIGSNCVILSGVTIGRGSIIGGGSVVTKDVSPYSIVGGNPAKVIKKRFSDEIISELEELQWWEWDIDKIKKNKNFFNKIIDNESNINQYIEQ